jgi:hypothetical protein
VVEIHAEAAVGDRALEIYAGGSDERDIDGFGPGAAEATNRAVLKDRQELALEGRGQEADLVEEKGAAVGGLKEAGLGLASVSEGATLVPEQLGFEERLGDGGAVDIDEGASVPRPRLMNRPGHETFTCTGLAEDENGRQAARTGLTGEQLRNLRPDRNDPGAFATQGA